MNGLFGGGALTGKFESLEFESSAASRLARPECFGGRYNRRNLSSITRAAAACWIEQLEARRLLSAELTPVSSTPVRFDGDLPETRTQLGQGADETKISVKQVEDDVLFSGYIPTNIPALPRPLAVSSADIDGDGDIDLITGATDTLSASANRILVLRNQGDGTFDFGATYAVGGSPYSVASADVDGDGDVDVLSANYFSNTVSVLLNFGNGTFATQMNYAVGNKPRFLTTADVDGDGDNDLITANTASASILTPGNTISVLNNNGNGTFATQVTYVVGFNPRSVTAADVDGDGKIDLITANDGSSFTPANSVSVLRNIGNGTFAAQVTYTVGTRPESVIVADVDCDRDLDLITANKSSIGTVSVLINMGNGVFAASVNYLVGNRPVSVTAADLEGDGDIDLISANNSSNTVSVLRNLGNGTFADQVTFAVGSQPSLVISADLNGDGDIDLITADFASNTLTLLENDGKGRLPAEVTNSVGSRPISVATADVDNDGDNDLFTANYANNTVSVLRNNGNSSFPSRTTYVVGSGPRFVTPADIDRDGDIDLITANYGSSTVSSNTISVLRNVGDGTFATRVTYIVGNRPTSVTSADIDGDGDADLITANTGNYSIPGNTVSVLRNNGDGTFETQLTYVVGSSPTSVSSADLDGDGDIDLITANFRSSTISVLKNNSDGTFAAQVTYAVGRFPYSVISTDIDRDGDADLITANYSTNTISVLRNNGNGNFSAKVDYAIAGFPTSITAADIDGDRQMDLITANNSSNTISVLRNMGNGTFVTHAAYAVGSNPSAVTSADMDGDGFIDLITAITGTSSSPGNTISVLRNNGYGAFDGEALYSVGSSPRSVTSADVDGDGRTDLITANSSSDTISVLRGDGTGNFSAQVTYAVGSRPRSVSSADVDGDGDVDLVTANYNGNSVSVLRNNDDGTFASHVTYAVGKSPSSVTSTDVDGDGDVDLITINSYIYTGGNSVSVLLNKGDGTFAAQVNYGVGIKPVSLTTADVDGDGDIDLVTANYGTTTNPGSTVSVLRNNGDGTFAAHVTLTVGRYPTTVTAADVDGDGDIDLISASSSRYDFSILKNNGDGTFAEQSIYTLRNRPNLLVTADVDGDGDLDLIALNRVYRVTVDTVSVLRNDGNGRFAPQANYFMGGDAVSLTTADVDADGDIDLVAGNGGSTVSILYNQTPKPRRIKPVLPGLMGTTAGGMGGIGGNGGMEAKAEPTYESAGSFAAVTPPTRTGVISKSLVPQMPTVGRVTTDLSIGGKNSAFSIQAISFLSQNQLLRLNTTDHDFPGSPLVLDSVKSVSRAGVIFA